MRPRLHTLPVLVGGLILGALLAADTACAQHAGHGGHAVGGHVGGTPGGAHHPGGGAGGSAGTHHHGGVAAYGYGAGPTWGFGAGYGLPYASFYGGAAPSFAGPFLPYSSRAAVLPTATYPGAAGLYAGPVGGAYNTPLSFFGIGQYDSTPATSLSSANRPTDDAGHFELILPPEAEVFVNGVRTEQTGFIRHYNTPKLAPGFSYTYQVRVRYMNEHGDMVADTRDIQFRANDWFRIDFTRLPPPQTMGKQ